MADTERDVVKVVAVTIGRNANGPGYDGRPIPHGAWLGFVSGTSELLARFTTEAWVSTQYTGRWNGRPEDAYVFYGPLRTNANTDDLRARLANLGGYYGQEAIGLTIGFGELVESTTVTIAEGITEEVTT